VLQSDARDVVLARARAQVLLVGPFAYAGARPQIGNLGATGLCRELHGNLGLVVLAADAARDDQLSAARVVIAAMHENRLPVEQIADLCRRLLIYV